VKYAQMSRYGAIAKALPFTFGKVFFVIYASETSLSDIQETYPVDTDGVTRVYTSLSAAYDATTTNRNDVVILDGNTSHTLTAMLTISKNRIHFVGLEWLLGVRKRYGQASKVVIGVTTATANVAMITNTGVRNSFRGIKFDSQDTLTEGITCFAEGGEYTYFENCEFYKATHLDSDTAAELLLNGDSSQFKDCTIGDLVNTTVSTAIRPRIRLAREIITGKVCRDCRLDGCEILTKAANNANRLVYSAGATDVERRLVFKDCIFAGAKLGAATADQAIGGAAALTEGQIILKDCAAYNIDKWSPLTGVIGNMPTADASMDTVGIQAA